jgi:hypothetical protein
MTGEPSSARARFGPYCFSRGGKSLRILCSYCGHELELDDDGSYRTRVDTLLCSRSGEPHRPAVFVECDRCGQHVTRVGSGRFSTLFPSHLATLCPDGTRYHEPASDDLAELGLAVLAVSRSQRVAAETLLAELDELERGGPDRAEPAR